MKIEISHKHKTISVNGEILDNNRSLILVNKLIETYHQNNKNKDTFDLYSLLISFTLDLTNDVKFSMTEEKEIYTLGENE